MTEEERKHWKYHLDLLVDPQTGYLYSDDLLDLPYGSYDEFLDIVEVAYSGDYVVKDKIKLFIEAAKDPQATRNLCFLIGEQFKCEPYFDVVQRVYLEEFVEESKPFFQDFLDFLSEENRKYVLFLVGLSEDSPLEPPFPHFEVEEEYRKWKKTDKGQKFLWLLHYYLVFAPEDSCEYPSIEEKRNAICFRKGSIQALFCSYMMIRECLGYPYSLDDIDELEKYDEEYRLQVLIPINNLLKKELSNDYDFIEAIYGFASYHSPISLEEYSIEHHEDIELTNKRFIQIKKDIHRIININTKSIPCRIGDLKIWV